MADSNDLTLIPSLRAARDAKAAMQIENNMRAFTSMVDLRAAIPPDPLTELVADECVDVCEHRP